MAYSYQSHTSTGTVGPYSFAAIDGYLSIDHIKVYVNNSLQSTALYSVDEVNKEVTFNAAVTSGSTVLIKRETPKTLADRQVVFSAGAVVRPDDLNNAHLQTMFIAQETEDYSIKDPPADQKAENYVLTWDADTSEWISAAQTGGGGGGGSISDGTYGDIAVTANGGTWTVRDSVISTTKMGSDVTTAGKALLTATDAAAQRTAMQISEAGHTGSYTDLTNKPTLSPVATSGSYTDLSAKPVNATTAVSGYMSATDKSKLDGVAAGAEVNVQSDWNVINTSDDAFIKNKPTVPVNLDDLSNVSSTTPTNGQVLKWNDTSSLWEPAADNTQGGAGTNADTLDSQDGTYYLDRTNHTGSQAISTVTNLQTTLDGKASSSHSHTLANITDAGTSASLNVPATGNAATTEVVLGTDTRLSDTRTPTDGTVTTAKIVDANVTYGKIQSVTSARLLGRFAGVDGTVQEITAQNGLSINSTSGAIEPSYGTASNTIAEGNHTHSLGDLSNVSNTSPSDGQVLKYNSTAGEWQPGTDLTSAGGGAPTDATYLTLTANGTLSDERLFTVGTGLTATDSGAGGAYSIEVDFGSLQNTVAEGNHTHTHTDSYVGHIETPANGDYYIDAYAATARTITGFYAICTSGTCTAVLDNAGSTVVSHAVSSTSGAATGLTNTSVAANTAVKITLSSVSTVVAMRFVVKYTETI